MDRLSTFLMAATAAYVSTNVDGYALLLGFFGNARYRAVEVLVGQFVSVAVQVALAIIVMQVGWRHGAPFIGLVGIVPLVVGLKRIAVLRRGGGAPTPDATDRRFSAKGCAGRVAAVSIVATSGAIDNVLVYSSVLAGHTLNDAGWVAAVFAVLTVALCAGAFATARSCLSAGRLRAAAACVAPFMTTAIGLSLLVRFQTLAWIYSLA